MDKKKITIAVVAVAIVIAIAIIVFLLTKNTNTIYTISFNTDGGNEVVSLEIRDGKVATKPADPTKEGYEFLGWYLNGELFDFSEPIQGNITLEARWKKIVVEDDKNDDKVDADNKDEVTKYTVKFDVDGKIVSTKTVEKNKTVKAPTAPTKDGYTFKGWYLGNTKYDFSKKVTKNITLTAKWEKVEEQKPAEPEKPSEPDTPVIPEVKEYTVKFDVDGKIVSTKTVKEGEKVAEPSKPTKDGYTFLGWYLDGKEFDFSTKISKDITIVAKFEKVEEEPEVKEYTVTFNTDGGSTVKAQTVKENEIASKPGNPTRKWDIFKGWYLDGKEFNFNTKITKNITLTAKWDEVTIYVDENTGSATQQVGIYVKLNGVNVAGTVDVTRKGKTITLNVPATGNFQMVKDTYDSISNPKVK